jgi:DNA polymerase elongation subunit (family B)
MQYNISPETYVGKNVVPSIEDLITGTMPVIPDGVAIAANGCMYRKDFQGFLPELMQKMYDDRVLYKKKMIEAKQQYEKTPTYELEKQISRYHNLQFAKKIQLNSAYGALGNQYFRWFDLKHAEAITMSGQLAIRWIETRMNVFMNKMMKTNNKDYVIASDTDSIYVVMDDVVQTVFGSETEVKTHEKMKEISTALDKFIESRVQTFIDIEYQKLADMMHAYQQKMKMKRESIANKGIWTAKKKYILNVWDSEGVQYSEAKLKMMGIEAVRSSTPSVCRDRIKKALDIIMNEDENTLIKFIDKFRLEFYEMSYEEVAFPRGCKGMANYRDASTIYKKSTPIHVRGALLYNKMLKDKSITTVDTIKDGDKIKFCYLRLPNPIRENVISTLGPLPKQFGLEKYIDYATQFEKSFIDPISIILNVIDWSHEKKNTIDSFWD